MKKVLLVLMILVAVFTIVACTPTEEHKHIVTGELIVVKEATCAEEGTAHMFCTECGEIVNTIAIPKTNSHTAIVIPAVESTCAETGLTEGNKCSVCNEILVAQQETPLKTHTEEILPGVESTCTQTGLTEGKKCSFCGVTIVAQQTVPVTTHTYDDKFDETCNKCGFIRDTDCAHRDILIFNGYGATCTSTGLTEGAQCKKCGEIFLAQTVIPTKPHTEVIDAAVEATCTSIGFTEGKHCSTCNLVLVAQTVVAKLPHTEVIDEAVEATCTSTGLTEGKHCSVCNATIVAQTVTDKIAHTEVIDMAVAPTCIATGLTEGKHCSSCNDIIVAQTVVNALGHDMITDPAVAPTCETIGLTEGSHCSRCSHNVPQTKIAKIDHTVSFGEMLNYYVSIKDTDAGNSLVSGATKEELLGHYDGLMYFKDEMDEYITFNQFVDFVNENKGGVAVSVNSYCKNIFLATDTDGDGKAKMIELLRTTSGTNAMTVFPALRELILRFTHVYDQINAPCSHTEFLGRIDELINLLAEDRLEPDYVPFAVGKDDPAKQEAAKNLYIMYYNTKCPLDHEGKLD